jgi:aminoglycoside phosphotransferase (APT) family kinase protein
MTALGRPLGELVARGTRSSIYAYGRGAVVKLPHPSTPSAWIESEAWFASAAYAVGALVPRPLGIEQIEGRSASVWERVEGNSMWEAVIQRPRVSAEVGAALAEVQQRLFELAPPVTLPRQRDRLVTKIRRASQAIDPSLIRALDLVPPSEAPSRLCHGDLHPSNVIMSRDGPIIVDWFDASSGDRLADVARTLLTLLGDGSVLPLHLPGSDRRTLTTLTDAYLSAMRAGLAISDDLLERWYAVQAVARLAEGVQRNALLEVWRRFEEATPREEPSRLQAAG